MQTLTMKKAIFSISIVLVSVSSKGQAVWSTDVAPILYTHCTVCHRDGGIGPFSLMTYAQAAVMGPMLLNSVIDERMPPWPPDPDYSSFAHERVLSPEELATLSQWVANAMPEGNSALAPTPPTYADDGFISVPPDLEISMPGYTSQATPSSDDYSCFAIPTNLLQNKKLRGFEVIPGNPSIVHHALVYLDTSATYPTNTSGFCMRPTDGLLGGFTPGALPTIFPSDGDGFNLGVNIPAGSNMVLAMHYPHGSAGETDQTRLRLWFYPDETPIREVITAPVIQNWSFALPPNEVTEVSASFDAIPADVSLMSVFPHMHLLGERIESYATTPNSEVIPLVRINRWDFHWQSFYAFRNLVRIPSGSTIHGEGLYDNTANNGNNPNDPPQWVGAGLNTSDEMFLIYFQFLPYQPGDELIDLEPLTQLPTTLAEQMVHPIRMNAYPNPASDHLWIDVQFDQASAVTFRLYDLTGRMVYSADEGRILPAGSHLKTIATSHLKAGTYLIAVTVNGVTHTRQVAVR